MDTIFAMLKLRSNGRNSLVDPYFWIGIISGWILFSIVWTNNDGGSVARGRDSKCLPCVEKHCKECKTDFGSEGDKIIGNGFYRDFPWKPQNTAEVESEYWRMSSQKYRDGMANEEPRVGINGMWRLERDEVVAHLKKNADQDSEDFTFKRMIRNYDPFYGVSYIVHGDTRDGEAIVPIEYEVRRKFRSGKPSLVDINLADDSEIVHIITPLSKVSERFHKFLKRLETNIYYSNEYVYAKLIFVIFGDPEGEDGVETIAALEKFQKRNPKAYMEHKFVNGDFSRAIGLDTGVMMCSDNALMVFLDVDLSITPEFLSRTRANTVQHERVVFPIMFSQFDPDVIKKYTETLQDHSDSNFADHAPIGEDKGFWIYYAFGVASMYKSDYLAVGGFPLDIVGWGGEDVNIFKKFIAHPDLDVMSTVDPDLIHIYHQRSCDVRLAPDQYRMCIGALSETIGSETQVGTLYLKHNEKEYFGIHGGGP